MIPLKDEIPLRNIPVVTISLVVLNLLVHIPQLALSDRDLWVMYHRFGAIPAALSHGLDPFPSDGLPVWMTVFTGLFVHSGLVHLAGNMLYLWIFGKKVEDVLGPIRYILFYLLCGAAATMMHILVFPNSTTPVVGASGAIAGIMGAYLLWFPTSRILTLFLIIFYPVLVYLPAMILIGLWFILQLINAGTADDSGVAWFAHIGGFIFGMAAVNLMVSRKTVERHRPSRNR